MPNVGRIISVTNSDGDKANILQKEGVNEIDLRHEI